MRRLLPQGSQSEWRDASGAIQLCEMHIDESWYGSPVALIENITPARVAFITRLGEGLIPDEHTVLQDGDLVHMIVHDSEITIVENALAHSPEEAS
jgi:trk system potassium uptake protein TrkA